MAGPRLAFPMARPPLPGYNKDPGGRGLTCTTHEIWVITLWWNRAVFGNLTFCRQDSTMFRLRLSQIYLKQFLLWTQNAPRALEESTPTLNPRAKTSERRPRQSTWRHSRVEEAKNRHGWPLVLWFDRGFAPSSAWLVFDAANSASFSG